MLQPSRVASRKTIFRECDPAVQAYLVQSGLVRTYRAFSDGHQQGLRLVGPGGAIGLDALSARQYRQTAETVAPSVICALAMSDLHRMANQNAEVWRGLCLHLMDEIDELRGRLHALGLRRARRKVIAFVVGLIGKRDGDVVPAVRQRDVADFLDMAPETVCRVVADLKRRGLVSASRTGLRPRNVAALRRAAEDEL